MRRLTHGIGVLLKLVLVHFVIVTDQQELAGVLNDYSAKVFTEEDIRHVPDDPVFDTTKQVPIVVTITLSYYDI